MTVPSSLLAAIESAFNSWLALDPKHAADLKYIDGKVIGIHLRVINQSFYLLPSNNRFMVLGQYEGETDVSLTGSPLAFIRQHYSDHPSGALFDGDIQIDGDLGVSQGLQRVFDSMDIDWEEQLSRVTGDLLAHQLGNIFRNSSRWINKTRHTLEQDTSEYLQEEARSLPGCYETNLFLGDVDQLRNDTDRLDARIKRLYRKQQESNT